MALRTAGEPWTELKVSRHTCTFGHVKTVVTRCGCTLPKKEEKKNNRKKEEKNLKAKKYLQKKKKERKKRRKPSKFRTSAQITSESKKRTRLRGLFMFQVLFPFQIQHAHKKVATFCGMVYPNTSFSVQSLQQCSVMG